jgi:hypothetical protein
MQLGHRTVAPLTSGAVVLSRATGMPLPGWRHPLNNKMIIGREGVVVVILRVLTYRSKNSMCTMEAIMFPTPQGMSLHQGVASGYTYMD